MADDNTKGGERLTSTAPLVEYLAAGCKPPENWRIGTEHEKFGYHHSDLSPLTYEGETGIREFLTRMERFGWKPVLENGNPIAMDGFAGGAISLEPAGQLELSGAPLKNIHETCNETTTHMFQVKEVAREMGIGFLGLGYRPNLKSSEAPWMPKARYKIMQKHMPKKGNLGLEMMQSTCTVQVNLDFDSEETMVKMFRVSLALQPVATALWANSPFRDSKPSGFLSFRSHIWTDTDPDRCGILPFVFEEGFGFERYAEYMLDVPMYFVYRNGVYIDASGQSFRDFLKGKLPALPGEYPTIKDWEDHLSTAFPEVRLKQFLEMRGADGGPTSRLCALPAFWVGLLYDTQALNDACALIEEWTLADHELLRAEVPRTALGTSFRCHTVRELALDVLQISYQGLQRRERLDSLGLDETHYLKPLFQIAEAGYTPAEDLLRAYEGRWAGDVRHVFQEYSY